jgi:hypothetical protein
MRIRIKKSKESNAQKNKSFKDNKKKKLKELYKKAEEDLDKYEREKYLFLCLKVPADSVKLCVVRCLFNVDIPHYKPEEASKLVQILEAKNIGAGEMELVLAHVFWIFTRFCEDKKANELLKDALKTANKNALEILEVN